MLIRALFLSLLLVSLTVRAESFVMSQGDTTVSLQQTAVGAAVAGAGAYALTRSGNARFYGAHGEMSNKTISAGIKQKVPKSTVFKNLLANAKKGKLAGGWWGVASSIVAGYLANEGYMWMKDQQEWVKTVPDSKVICFSKDHFSDCSKDQSAVKYFFDGPATVQQISAKRLEICESAAKAFNAFPSGYTFGSFALSPSGVCSVHGKPGGSWTVGYFRDYVKDSKLTLTQSAFDAIIEPEADKDPLPFIDATRPERDKPVPGLAPGALVLGGDGVLVTDPYRIGDKVYQTEWRISRAADGSPVISPTVIARPDLEKAGIIESIPVAKPQDIPTDTPTTSTPPTTVPPIEIPDTCEQNPDSLGCAKLGEGEVPELILPSSDNNFSWSPSQFLPNSAACPADKTFKVAGHSFSIGYDNICNFLAMIRPAVIAACMIIAAVMIFNFLRAK